MTALERNVPERQAAPESERSQVSNDVINEIIKLRDRRNSCEPVPVLDKSNTMEQNILRLLPPDDPTRQMYDRVQPSVVKITSPLTATSFAIGSGFFVDKEGRIVTAEHVIDGAARPGEITVTTSDGIDYKASLEKVDLIHDLAVLKIDKTPDGINPLPLGDGFKLKQGEPIYTVGHPEGVAQTVISPGNFTRMENRFNSHFFGELVLLRGRWDGYPHTEFAVIDSHTEPGNSGGPTVDSKGRVIGVLDMNNLQDGNASDLCVSSGLVKELLASKDPAYLPGSASLPAVLTSEYINSWQKQPLITAAETAGIGYLLYALQKTAPAFFPLMTTLTGGTMAVSDFYAMKKERCPERMSKHWMALGTDLAMVAGGASSILMKRPTALTLGLAAAGFAGRLAVDCVPKFHALAGA